MLVGNLLMIDSSFESNCLLFAHIPFPGYPG